MIKTTLLSMALCTVAAVTYGQAVDAVKETGKTVAEKTMEGGDKAKASVESGSEKAVDKSKAAVHKAKARYHKHRAKADADAAIH